MNIVGVSFTHNSLYVCNIRQYGMKFLLNYNYIALLCLGEAKRNFKLKMSIVGF
jgi:hypothetical protein